MSIDVISIPLGVLGLAIGLYRLMRRHRFPSRSLAVVVLSLGAGLLVRSPWLGDQFLDDVIGSATGWSNVPDLAGHLLTFLALGGLLEYLYRALGYKGSVWLTRAVLLGAMLLCVVLYAGSPARTVQATNMVQLAEMESYSVTFSALLLIVNVFMLFVVLQARRADGWHPHILFLCAGAVGGQLMAVHRLAVVAIPEVTEWSYDLVTWIFTLMCAGGYFIAVLMLSRRTRTA
ncbi:hypothetical protein [Corynebacterium kalidii]